MLTRRNFFYLTSASITLRPLAAGSSEFWDKKPPSDWSSDEIDRLLTKSPWAKDAATQYTQQPMGGNYPNGGGYPGGGGGYPGGGGTNRGGISIPGIPGIGGLGIPGRGGNSRTGQPRGGQGTAFRGTVRWESAQPIRDALKTPLPDDFEKHYVIAITGIPLLESRHGEDDDNRPSVDSLDDLAQLSSLQVKGKDYVQAGMVKRQAGTGNVFLFGFSKEMLAISKSDSEITFATKLNHVNVKARFSPKEMLYHGELAV
jgi:hypothetical protein